MRVQRYCRSLAFSAVLCLAPGMARGFSGGDGSVSDPYRIANKADLKLLSDSSAYWGRSFRLVAAIVFDSSDFGPGGGFHNNGEGFSPIGSWTSVRPRFRGNFDGANLTITGLRINRSNSACQGLFCETDTGSVIENIGLENIRVAGLESVGGLVARIHGIVRNAYVTGWAKHPAG